MRSFLSLTLVTMVGGCSCNGGDNSDTNGNTDTDASTTCASTMFSEIGRVETDVGMVSRVTWSAPGEVEAHVEFGPAGDCAKFSTNTVTGTDGEFLLIGLGPSVEGCWELVGTSGGTTERCGAIDYTTGPPPQGLQVPSVTINDGGDEPWIIAALILPPAQFALNREGEIVWANVLPVEDDRQTTDMHINDARDGFNYNDYAADHSIDDSYARFIGYDGQISSSINMPLGHHSYELFDDGRIVYSAIDLRTSDYIDKDGLTANGPVVGDSIIEQMPDGTQREIWNSWNDLARLPIVEDVDNTSFYPQGLDWIHADYFESDPARGSYVVSCRNINTLLELSDVDGSWMRSVGEFGEYTIVGEPDWNAIIGHPHNTHVLDNGNWLFLTMPDHGQEESQVLELAFDDVAKTATVVWAYGEGLGFDAQVEGAGDRLPNGNTLVNWGVGGTIQEVTPEKAVVWEAVFSVGAFAGHAHAVDSFYPTP